MNRFKTWFKEFQEIYPDVHHDEIDCGLAWKYALIWVQALIKKNPECGETMRLYEALKKEIGK
jgi:hypothetical protein